jgi:hypothetical protein
MIINTPFKVDSDLYRKCIENATHLTGKITLNKPTNRFFYDPWEIKEEYRNTIWEDVLNTLPKQIGEARLLTLESGKCYFGHADIDDRYHLTLTGKKSFLVDLEKDQLHSLENDGKWYDMNAGLIHSAVNFGDVPRIQLVVRKLLPDSSGYPSKKIKIILNTDIYDARYYFDAEVSYFLNRGCKLGIINSFTANKNIVEFNIHEDFVKDIISKSCERYTVTSSEDTD